MVCEVFGTVVTLLPTLATHTALVSKNVVGLHS